MSTVDVDPSTLFGGTWERIKDTFLLAAGDNYAAGSTGGSTSHTHTNPNTSTLSANTGAYSGTSGSTAITTDQMPSHSHTRGTMDITGDFVSRPHKDGYSTGWGGAVVGSSGAFSLRTHGNSVSHGGVAESGTTSNADLVSFRASNSWSGSTSSVGSGQGHTHSIPSHTHSMNHSHTVGNTGSSSNMPPYLTVYCWRRTA